MKFEAIEEKEFLNPYYRKKPILEAELNEFIKALKDYKSSLENNLKNNEDSLVANALSKFFENLHFECEIKSIHKGNSGIDLALKKDKQIQVIIEAKLPHSKEFFSPNKPNCKALHECILYYLRERKALNSSLKHIIITDFYHFYIFKADLFEELFNKNKYFKEAFENFESKNSFFKGNTDEFYKECEKLLSSEKYLDSITRKDLFDEPSLKGIFIDLKPILEQEKSSFRKLKPLFKIFHKDFLLSEFNPNDANSLNNAFYKELLYILGLCESKQNSKLIIAKSEESKEEQGTFYTAINSKLEEENFETILKLLILWLNRILFLKLIESNLVRFNDDKNLKFLNFKKIPDFDKLSELFFEILAKERSTRKKSEFAYLPYLNSSLFEKQSIENMLEISNLNNDLKLNYYKNTVLKDDKCKAKKGQVGLLEYLFEFLDSFDFGSDDEQSEILSQKELISSSVLGNVFEKLNGYKEGSFYTPSFITSYMCKESITKVVLDKFNAKFDLKATDISELRKALRKEDKNAQKELLNSIKICDPAVGSGHFLVSALNVMLSIYDELNLFDEEFYLEVQNDEILITNRKGEFVEYKRPHSDKDKAHLIQKELFYTKKDIIENNLFGVDINPNSCEITKLRLWIELLKHSFYQSFEDEAYHDLKTLPNIDINIKCGNSLISRFKPNDKFSNNNIKSQVEKYKNFVKDYKNPNQTVYRRNKEELRVKIKDIKAVFALELKNPSETKKLQKAIDEHMNKFGDFMLDNETLFEGLKGLSKEGILFKKELSLDEQKKAIESFYKIKAQRAKIDYEMSGEEFENSFEWRFEFPEILDDDGNFQGFDLIIANPPYIDSEYMKKYMPIERDIIKKNFKTAKGNWDIYIPFIEQFMKILNKDGVFCFIVPDKWLSKPFGLELRKSIYKYLYLIKQTGDVFDSALIDSIVAIGCKRIFSESISFLFEDKKNVIYKKNINIKNNFLLDHFYIHTNLLNKIEQFQVLNNICECENACSTSETYILENYIQEMHNDCKIQDFFKIINTGIVGKYVSKFDNKPMKYLKKSILKPVCSRSDFLNNFGKKYTRIAQSNKIIIKGLTLLDCCLDLNSEIIPAKGTLVITSSDKNLLKFIAAILNSPLAYFYIKEKYQTNNYCGGINFTKDMFNCFPIPKINSKNQKIADELVNLVDEILKAKEQDKNANTQELENKINSLVYKLYNLTEDEIKIIENR
ncbi:TPA: Eco57I restriction-modification methylase domain-containing protein [Campylobacter coli]|nr:Eco57I restriction-modification methylase domain-containing protein [Campylobacter coli]